MAKVMIPCKRVADLLLSDELSSQSWWTRVEVRLHLAMCRFCTRLERQIEQLGVAARQDDLDDQARKELEGRVIRRLTDER